MHSKELQNNEMEASKERYISPEERQRIIDDLRLAQQDNGISKNSKFVRQHTRSTI